MGTTNINEYHVGFADERRREGPDAPLSQFSCPRERDSIDGEVQPDHAKRNAKKKNRFWIFWISGKHALGVFTHILLLTDFVRFEQRRL